MDVAHSVFRLLLCRDDVVVVFLIYVVVERRQLLALVLSTAVCESRPL
jgi:hypothetical protein